MKLRSPLALAAAAGLLVLIVALAPMLWQMTGPMAPVPAPAAGSAQLPAPWVIERGSQGDVSAFGLQLPAATLAHAVGTLGRRPAAGLDRLAATWTWRSRPMSNVGQVAVFVGKLVLAADAQPAELATLA